LTNNLIIHKSSEKKIYEMAVKEEKM